LLAIDWKKKKKEKKGKKVLERKIEKIIQPNQETATHIRGEN